MFTMLLFLRIKQKLTRIKLRPVGNEGSSVVKRLMGFERGEISTNNVTIPATSSLHDHWDRILVPVSGCRCASCDIRPAVERQRRKRKPRTQASAPVRGLPPQHSVIDMLYTFPCSESQRQNAILAASRSSARIPMKGQRLQSHRPIVNKPGFEPSPRDTSLNLPPGMQSPRLHSDPGIDDPSAVSCSPTYDISCTDNRSIPQKNYDVLANPSNYVYLSTLSD